MPILPKSAYDIKLPVMHRVKQIFPDEILKNIRGKIDRDFENKTIRESIEKDQRIAVLVGSRGISNLPEVVTT